MSGSDEILSLPAPAAGVVRLAYGLNRHQFGDLRLPPPQADALYPVVIGVHGGYYRARYGLSYFGHAMAALTEAGFATWNIEYRRLGYRGGGWPGTFQDVGTAADYLRTLAANYPLDLRRVADGWPLCRGPVGCLAGGSFQAGGGQSPLHGPAHTGCRCGLSGWGT